MKYSKLFIHSALLFTISTLPLYPNAEVYGLKNPENLKQVRTVQTSEQFLANHHFLSYDEILDLLDDLENGELEKKCNQADLARVNHFIAHLAKQGSLTNESFNLDQEIQELLDSPNQENEYLFFYGAEHDELTIPALFYGEGEVILCKSWIHKKWDQTKKFAKKHKKEILIGAAVVVAGAIVICVVAAASTATIATAVAAGAAGAAAAEPYEKMETEATSPDFSPALFIPVEAPILTAEIEEHVSTFKEVISKNILQTSNTNNEGSSFTETVRNFGSILAHQALDGISEVASFVPQLLEEIKDIGYQLIPEVSLFSDNVIAIAPLENYEKLIAQGHEKIDEVFSTNQAQLYSPEIKERKNNFSSGIIPLPGMLPEIFANSGKLLDAGKVIDRAGLNKAGRGLMKHGYREGSVFPKPTGTVEQINEHGLKVLEEILNHPEKTVIYNNTRHLGEVVDIQVSGIGGVRFNPSGEMIGFLEP